MGCQAEPWQRPPPLRSHSLLDTTSVLVIQVRNRLPTFHRGAPAGAQFDAERITVEIDGHRAILKGTVRSYAELKDVERAVRNAPGITEVENHLTVDPSIYTPV
jgi:hypothetical protein